MSRTEHHTADKRYPEHNKMTAARSRIEAVTEFLEWAGSKRYVVLRPDDARFNSLDWADYPGIQRLLSEHFEISERQLEVEKREILAEMRAKYE